MLSKEDFEKLVNKIKDGLDDTTSALISEDLLNVISNYNMAVDSIEETKTENDKLKADKDELLKVNGRLFQKIGFDKEDAEDDGKKEEKEDDKEEIKIEDVIDEKGEIIDE